MKKTLFVVVTCILSILASAQKITEKDLQGKWNLAVLTTEGIHMDMITGVATLSEELKSELTPNILNQLNENMKQGIAILKSDTTLITGNAIKQYRNQYEKNGTFIIKDTDGKQYIQITFKDGSTVNPEVFIKEHKLHLIEINPRETMEYIYLKK